MLRTGTQEYQGQFMASEEPGEVVVNTRAVERLRSEFAGEPHAATYRSASAQGDPFLDPLPPVRRQDIATRRRELDARLLDPDERLPIRGQRVRVPEFEIASNPNINLHEIQRRRYNLMDRSYGSTNPCAEIPLGPPAPPPYTGPRRTSWQRIDADDFDF
jgi:hypothetical protein